MRLILVDRSENKRQQFWPLVLSRPIWELRCGMTSLTEKLQAKVGTSDVAYFLPDYLAEVYRERTDRPVNDMSALTGQDVLLVDARVKADTFDIPATGRSEVGLDEQGEVLYARILQKDLKKLPGSDIDALLSLGQDQPAQREKHAADLAVHVGPDAGQPAPDHGRFRRRRQAAGSKGPSSSPRPFAATRTTSTSPRASRSTRWW